MYKHTGPDPFDIIVGTYLWGCLGWIVVSLVVLALVYYDMPHLRKFQARQVIIFPLWPFLLVRNLWRWARALAKVAFP